MKVVEAALPENESVAVSGTKWTVAKALSLKYQKVKEDGVGTGEARCKKPAAGPWSVTVE